MHPRSSMFVLVALLLILGAGVAIWKSFEGTSEQDGRIAESASLALSAEVSASETALSGAPRAQASPSTTSTTNMFIAPVDDQVHAALDDWTRKSFIDGETRDWERFELVHFDIVEFNLLVSAAPASQFDGHGPGPPSPPTDREADFGIKLFDFAEMEGVVTNIWRYDTQTSVVGFIRPGSVEATSKFSIAYDPSTNFVHGAIETPDGRFLITTTPDPGVMVVLWNPPPPPGNEAPSID